MTEVRLLKKTAMIRHFHISLNQRYTQFIENINNNQGFIE